MTPSRILVLAPHTDDGELGCGASIAHFISGGSEVFYAAFSLCENSLPEGWAPDTLKKECIAATAQLGIEESHVFFHNFPVRHFPQHRQDILEILVKLNRELKPDLVFIPAADDVHQDHQVIHNEARRAFRQTGLLGYELPWNQSVIRSNFFVAVSESDLRRKAAALSCYESQHKRSYMQPGFVEALARVRGVQGGSVAAEAFEVYRLYAH
ncbi:PIG-L deacetylase family protein [Terrimonas ferruginea]|uniref:PIG-L deacetylase family protein n=1 Tax=Terrimonas ferruginea TaxID=249 RepID=UPI0004216C6C|nr:PIG-L deacetylase family protein [Terrimonas ferruginea]